MKRTIGILGLSADPGHRGHVEMGMRAQAQLGLDEVWFTVSPQSPFKKDRQLAPTSDRLTMLRYEIEAAGAIGLRVSDFEAALVAAGVVPYTVNVLDHFVRAFPEVRFVWLMGADNFCEMHTWGDRWDHILKQFAIGVFPRRGTKPHESVAAKLLGDGKRVPKTFAADPGTWCLIEGVQIPVSSTKIRAAVKKGDSCPDGLCQASSDHIHYERAGIYVHKDPTGGV